jgi:fructokinase
LAGFRIGIDMGGTKIEALALDPEGSVQLKRRVPTPRDYAETLETIADLIIGLENELQESGRIGIGTPGAISPHTGLIKNANSTWINGKPLARDLTKLLGRPLRFDNDANCFTLSEARDGAAAGARVVFGVIVGTGTGGGLVVEGKILRGANAITGEWGHIPLPSPQEDERPGPDCYCGRTGCIETFLSGPGLTRDYEAETGRHLEPQSIVQMAANGEREAEESLARYEDRMARGLAGVINLIDPDVIILGGGLSNIERLYVNVPSRWSRYIFSDHVSTKFFPAVHGNSSGSRGAAMLWES